MTLESEILTLCAEAIANIRMGYEQSACLIMDEAISEWRQAKFEQMVDSISPLLKGGLCERSLKLFREPNASIP